MTWTISPNAHPWENASSSPLTNMPIHQVTHVNHVGEPPEDVAPIHPAEPLASLAAAEDRLGARKYFVRNPKLTKDSAGKFRQELEWGRNGLEAAGRFSQADQWKTASNVILKEGKSHAALIGYVVGIWYLRSGRPPCPMAVAHAVACAKDGEAEFSTTGITNEVAAWLEAGKLTSSEEVGQAAAAEGAAEAEADGVAALRTSLHLNAAAAALKLELWAAAKAACAVVLAVDATNAKALFRSAKALYGEGELKESMSTLVALIKGEPQNREARSLLDEVKARQAEEKAKFKNLFANGGGEAPAAAEPTFREAYEEHVRERELHARVYDGDEPPASTEDERERQRFHVSVADASPAPSVPRAGSALEAALAKSKTKRADSSDAPVSLS